MNPYKGRGTLVENRKSNTFGMDEKDHVALKMTDALSNKREGVKVLYEGVDLRVKVLDRTIVQDATFTRS